MLFRSGVSLLGSRLSRLRRAQSYFASLSPLNNQCDRFLPWLRRKAGHPISSVLSLGFSVHGRSLFASQFIQAGDCILRVPYSAQLTPDKIRPEIESLLREDVGNVSRLALVVLAEQRLGQDSEWAPYISCLPPIKELHNTVFWSKEELEMVRESSIYHETINYKENMEKDFLSVKPALEHFPQIFGDCRLEDFMHAYACVVSRAWRTSKSVSLIPFADFLNHDGVSEALLLSDEDKDISEVTSDRDYVVGEQVLIKYGRFPNTTLMLDYGFALSYNIHDQVEIWIDIPSDDPLHVNKMDLLCEHLLPPLMKSVGFISSGRSFMIKEVKSDSGNGKGIPLALRAFARVLSTTSNEELKALAMEAAEKDGRLARSSLKNKNCEIQAHRILLSLFTDMILTHDAAIKALQYESSPDPGAQLVYRRQMAMDLLKEGKDYYGTPEEARRAGLYTDKDFTLVTKRKKKKSHAVLSDNADDWAIPLEKLFKHTRSKSKGRIRKGHNEDSDQPPDDFDTGIASITYTADEDEGHDPTASAWDADARLFEPTALFMT